MATLLMLGFLFRLFSNFRGNPVVKTGKVIGIIRSLLYFAAGIFFVVSAASPSWVRLFGIMAIAYGIFRLYQSLRREEEEEDDEES
jgi:hypothetical protein